jgi:hypothetical protein
LLQVKGRALTVLEHLQDHPTVVSGRRKLALSPRIDSRWHAGGSKWMGRRCELRGRPAATDGEHPVPATGSATGGDWRG